MHKGKRTAKQQQTRNQRRRILYASLPTNPQGQKMSHYATKDGSRANPQPERPRQSFICPKCLRRENGQPHFGTCPK